MWTRLVVAVCVLAAIDGAARATVLLDVPWQQVVLDADFVGVIECQTAGGIVARFRVVESWEGPAAGTLVSIRMDGDFPIALCGQRFVVAASRHDSADRVGSFSTRRGMPLSLRRIPADLVDVYGSLSWLSRDGSTSFATHESRPLESRRREVCAVLRLPDDEAETLLLKVLAEGWLRPLPSPQAGTPADDGADDILLSLRGATNPDEALRAVGAALAAGRIHPALTRRLLRAAGRAHTLQELERGGPGTFGLSPNELSDVIGFIRARLGQARASEVTPEDARTRPPSHEEIAEAQKRFHTGRWEYGDVELLTRHAPEPVLEYLVTWHPSETDDADAGYAMGSYFAWACRGDRAGHLRRLTSARDSWVRVTGAVYLAFEDETAGTRLLKKLMRLRGDPGAWAALALARRGNDYALPRLLELFGAPGRECDGIPASTRLLRDRTRVLLSNAAAAAGLAQPSPPQDPWTPEGPALPWRVHEENVYRYYTRWWREHRRELVLTDPWADVLAQQNVD